MLDFITGWILGKTMNKPKETIVEPIILEPEPKKELPKVYKYVPLPDIYDFDATLETSYQDYKDVNLVVIHKNGHLIYYLEVYVPIDETEWGTETLRNFI